MYEIRIHSRGGQGGVTAARLLALAAVHDGRHATAFPFYGAERRGAPVVSFVRIDDLPIRLYSRVDKPDMVVVLDSGVMEAIDVLHGLKRGGGVVINSEKDHTIEGYSSFHVDLTGIALRENLEVAGIPVLDTPVLGAMAKLGIVSADSAKKAIGEMFSDERNVRAAEDAFREMAA